MEEIERLKSLGAESWDSFAFLEHQLGVLDTKASSVITLDGILITLATIFASFSQLDVSPAAKYCIAFGTLLILLSAGLCARIMRVTWASKLSELEIIKLRDDKTRYLHLSLAALLVGLVLMYAAFVERAMQR